MSSTMRTPCPSRSAPHHWMRLPDRRQPERLARVDGEVEVLPLQVLEGVQVPGGRVAGLGAGDVEADHAAVAVAHRELGDLHRAGRVPHGGQQGAHPDRPTGRAASRRPSANPSSTASTTSSSLRPRLEVLLGGEPHLGVDHAVVGQVLRALARPPGAATPRSASPRRCGRTSPGSAPASRSRPRREPPAQPLGVGGGQHMPDAARPAR